MPVCLTGDVHHDSLGTRDQRELEGTELEATLEYVDRAAAHDVPVTLFVTGRAADEEPDRVRRLADHEAVEVGGHNYYAFDTPVHAGWRVLGKATGGRLGSWNGPRRFQAWEIGRTVDALSARGATVTAWRDHAYRHDRHTASLLAEQGITHFSDAVGPDERVRREAGVTVVPVNTPPDHEHVYHAFRTPGSAAVADFEGPFGGESVSPDAWVDWVTERVEAVTAEGGVATVLAHPACMRLADGFEAFERLCEVLSAYETVRMSEVAATTAGRTTGGVDPDLDVDTGPATGTGGEG